MTTSTLPRAGRPPRITVGGDTFKVTVKGTTFAFRLGADGRLRGLGTRAHTADYDYARSLVVKMLVNA